MPENTMESSAKIANLEERVKKLAADKSYLELIISLMNQMSAVSGLDNMVENMLKAVSNVIGGVNLMLYYVIDNDIYYADVYGAKKKLDALDDALVSQVFETRQPVEQEQEFGDMKLLAPDFTKAYTWVVPLLVGTDLVGVVKMESLPMAMGDLSRRLPTFFNYAAFVLKNEILGHSKLKAAFDELSQENSLRRQAEAELRTINDALESIVAERTAEIHEVNQQLEAELAERKRAEAQMATFRALVENAADAIFITDLNAQISYANRSAHELFGYDAATQEMVGLNGAVHWPPEEVEVLQAAMAQAITTGGWSGDVRNQRKDGTLFYASGTLFAIRDEAGQPTHWAVIVRDVTAQKQAEAERERLQQEVIEAQRHAIQELSTPIIPVMDRIIVMPLIGSIDSMRARDITRSLLAGIREHRAKVVILDITGVPIVDSGVANHLNKTIQAARLKGARTIITGVSDAVAETIVDLGIDWSGVDTRANLQTGLWVALQSLGFKLSR